MPAWLTPLLKWGGLALAVVFAIAIIWTQSATPPEGGAEASIPMGLYWVLLIVGVVAAIAGFFLERRRA